MISKQKTAIVTGATGQDGSFLCELLLEKNYRVVGVKRPSSTDINHRIKTIFNNPNITIIDGDITDIATVYSWINTFNPDEVYNLAAQSHVGTSFDHPISTFRVNAEGTLNILEAIKAYSIQNGKSPRLFQASTSEMFGNNYSLLIKGPGGKIAKKTFNASRLPPDLITNKLSVPFQDEETPFSPENPYGISKLAAHKFVGLYRSAHNIHASCGILFNHDSERRGENFVTRKISKWVGDFFAWSGKFDGWEKPQFTFDDEFIHFYEQKFPKLRLGNLSPKRDWGYARDYVEAMWLMLQQQNPEDYIIASGQTHSIDELLKTAFKKLHIEDYRPFILQDPKFVRPLEVDYLCGDSSKALSNLGWKPKVSFEDMVDVMVNQDMLRSFNVHF